MIPNKFVTIFAGVFLTLGSVYLAILSWNAVKTHNYIGISEQQRHSITVNGDGEVIGVPDIAKIQLGYSVEKKTVAAAQKDNTDKMNAVIKKLKDDFKIDDKDIKTTDYSIYPQYDWSKGIQIFRGYEVNQSLEVKLREMEKVSQVLDEAGTLGLNQIGSLTFEIDNEEALKQEARIKAIEAAKTKAEDLAKVAGVKLGRIISFSESANGIAPVAYRSNYKVADEALGMGGAAPEIEAGSSEIKITATVEYEIL
ncbi:MAG: SIMPL domain-containing protein [Patescibacteria group bacterium]|nr:SIMPL domain-containing protein [Patescibacteria group bacterium]MDD5295077.1 SIMPL domain-containing protein [Patescibacteria group bacterium]MDD5554795.1 SIMPL domain-containing protein [Patescibacteria group bacterium]